MIVLPLSDLSSLLINGGNGSRHILMTLMVTMHYEICRSSLHAVENMHVLSTYTYID